MVFLSGITVLTGRTLESRILVGVFSAVGYKRRIVHLRIKVTTETIISQVPEKFVEVNIIYPVYVIYMQWSIIGKGYICKDLKTSISIKCVPSRTDNQISSKSF